MLRGARLRITLSGINKAHLRIHAVRLQDEMVSSDVKIKEGEVHAVVEHISSSLV